MLERGRVALVMAMTISTVAALAGGCNRGEEKAAYDAKPTHPEPGFRAESVETVSFDRIQKYAADLRFDPVLGAADELLVDFERSRVGTERAQKVRIEPERESYRLSRPELAQGRIIARLWSEVEVPKLGLGPRWTWWWVDSSGGRWRSVFIAESEKPAYRIALQNRFELMEPHYSWRQAIARFWVVKVASPQGDPVWVESWGTCGGCCRQRLVVLAPE
jgi:hypothetical protein